MIKNRFFLFLLLQFVCLTAGYIDNYRAKKAYLNGDFKRVVQLLEREQVDSPNNFIINYNLGTSYYKLMDFDKAKTNLKRSIQNCPKKDFGLKEMAYFNLGNSFYKSCLKILGVNWEKKYIDNNILDLAIKDVKLAIEKYQNTLVLNKKNKSAEFNKKKAEELLKKLEQKKREQSQEQNQNEGEKQNKEKNQQADNDNKKSKGKSTKNSNLPQKKNKNDQDQNSEQQDKGKNGSQDSKDDRNNRQDKDFKDKQTAQEKQDVNKDKQELSSKEKNKQKTEQPSAKKDSFHDFKNQENNSNNKKDDLNQKLGYQKESQLGNDKNNIKSRMFRAVLDDLQNEESKLQKKIIKHKTNNNEKILNTDQRPW